MALRVVFMFISRSRATAETWNFCSTVHVN